MEIDVADIAKALPHGITAIIAVVLYKLVEKVFLPIMKKAKEEEKKRQADDWNEVKTTIKELTKGISELFSTVKLQDHRITESESDIRELRAMVTGVPQVKH